MTGLSARRRAIDKLKRFISYFRQVINRCTFLALTMAFITLVSCDHKNAAQDRDSGKDKNNIASISSDSANKPKVNIKVNKRYDEKGNMIGFDSTYSSFYSTAKGDTTRMDSLMHLFDKYFNRNHSSFFDNHFNSLFFNDTMRYPDFFHKDFFLKRYELNDRYLRDMMNSMDSIKNQFYSQESKKEKHYKPLK